MGNVLWRENQRFSTIEGMSNPYLPYAKQSIDENDLIAVQKALTSDMITRGPCVAEFEDAVAKFCGAEYAVAFNSGTTALDAAAHAAQIEPYDRLYTTPNSFVGTIAGAMKRGAEPIFVDIDPITGNIALDELKAVMNQPMSRGKEVLLPVHFAGIAVDMQALSRDVRRVKTVIIEDAAHAIGSYYPSGEKVGSCSYSDMTVFSFHPAKHVTTGEGGCVLTNRKDLKQLLEKYRNNGIVKEEGSDPWVYDVQEITGNFNFTDIQAALGISQLKRVDEFGTKRYQLVKHYRKHLEGVVGFVPEEYDERTSYHILVVSIDFKQRGVSRAELMNALHKQGIGTQVHYIPLYRHSFFKRNLIEYFPKMETYYAQALTLPLFYDMTEQDVERVASALKKELKH